MKHSDSGRVLVVGGGGREHALAWKLRQSAHVTALWMTERNYAARHIADAAPSEAAALSEFCQAQQVSLAVIGGEAPLAAGLADVLRQSGVLVVGPSAAAAQIEASKIYAKQLMQRQNIPTADFAVCDSESDVEVWTRHTTPPFVVKADGLAAGKGVLICDSAAAARTAAAEIFAGKFGDGMRVLMESHVRGRELSVIVITDGERFLPLAGARDYKRLLDGDAGPNTGGMGAISPAPDVDAELLQRVQREVIAPALLGMREAATPFCGFLYAGLMVGDDGALSVLEFNCRLGDPETQVLIPRLRSDLYPLLLAAAQGQLPMQDLEWDARVAVGVVLAAAGYPDSPRHGDRMTFPSDCDAAGAQCGDCLIFHAGTAADEEGHPQTAGGRILTAVALDESPAAARERAYQTARRIQFSGAHCRGDIGL